MQIRNLVDRLLQASGPASRRVGRRAKSLGAAARQHATAFYARASRKARRIDRRYVAAAGIVVALFVVVVGIDVVVGSPSAGEIRTIGRMPVATVLFDRHDEPAFNLFHARRHEVALDEISPNLVNAVIAIEDQRFYDHHGLDLWRIAGSVWADIRGGGFVQGGSTITQQLARLSFLTADKTVRRKLKEAYLALRIERVYSKPEILELYLNKVYFGSGLYGAEAAARGYFGKSAAALTLDEAALLAGLIKAPSAYEPGEHLDRAVARRAVVLQQMAAAGMIDRQTAELMSDKPVALANEDQHATGAWFKQAVTRELVERFGWDLVSTGGLRVYTTYDRELQREAEQALAQGLDRIEKERAFRHPTKEAVLEARAASGGDASRAPDYLQGALVALDPSTGEVRALVGGRDFADSQFDRVTQARRQSGSAFKPFVYATALELGFSPATLITDLDRPIPTPEGPWLPDDGHDMAESMTVRTALRLSSNRAAAQMLQKIGISAAVDRARQMGLEAPPVPSLVLGSGDVTLLSLTTAYGVFASGGVLHAPRLIRRVEDASGAVLFESRDTAHSVLSPETSFQMAAMLADVVDRGTGSPARSVGFRLPAAGKTGTTNDYRDAWFVGFTPDLVAGVWVGFDRPKTIVPGGYASALAVPIWGTFMRDATAGHKARWLDRPDDIVGVEICQDSGLLPNPACSRVHEVSDDGSDRVRSHVVVEYFRRGTEPEQYCPIHRSSWLTNLWTGIVGQDAIPASRRVDGLEPGEVPTDEEGDLDAAAAGSTADKPDGSRDDDGKDDGGKKRGFWSRLAGIFTGGDDDGKRDRDRESDQD